VKKKIFIKNKERGVVVIAIAAIAAAVIGIVLAGFLLIFDFSLIGALMSNPLGVVGEFVMGNYGNLSQPSRSIGLSRNHIRSINENMSVYKKAAAEVNVPWEMLAAIHYRESDCNPNYKGVDGPFQITNHGNIDVKDFPAAARRAAEILQEKAGGKLTQDINDMNIIADAFWGYNGKAYGSVDNSPYVMNNWDDTHKGMIIDGIGEFGKRVHGPDSHDGALKIFIILKNATYNDDGKIIKIGDYEIDP